MKLIIQRNSDTGKIDNVWKSQKECAEALGVTQPAINVAVTRHTKCRGAWIEYCDIDNSVILEALQDF